MTRRAATNTFWLKDKHGPLENVCQITASRSVPAGMVVNATIAMTRKATT